MNNAEQPLLPVGKNCDCGHPLIWNGDQQHCAVYGTHQTETDETRRHRTHYWSGWRNHKAPHAKTVDLIDQHTHNTTP